MGSKLGSDHTVSIFKIKLVALDDSLMKWKRRFPPCFMLEILFLYCDPTALIKDTEKILRTPATSIKMTALLSKHGETIVLFHSAERQQNIMVSKFRCFQ